MDPTVKVVVADPKGSVLWDYIVNNVPEKDLKVKPFQVGRGLMRGFGGRLAFP